MYAVTCTIVYYHVFRELRLILYYVHVRVYRLPEHRSAYLCICVLIRLQSIRMCPDILLPPPPPPPSLQQSVVKIVREKYLNEAGSSDPAHRHAFLSKLYIFLTDEMHKGLGKLLSLEDPSAPPPSPVDCQLLKHFAVEAEVILHNSCNY